MFLNVCFLYSIFVFATLLGIHQVIKGLTEFRFYELILGVFMISMSHYMTGQLGPVLVELYQKL